MKSVNSAPWFVQKATMKHIILSLVFFVTYTEVRSATNSINLQSPSSRIVGGQDAKKHQFPYQVALKTKLGRYYCTGALISENYVLTNHECTRRLHNQSIAHFGLSNLDQNDGDLQTRKIAEYITHPLRHRGLRYYDIALLRLEAPVNITDAVKPIALASGDECEALGNATFSGWGGVKNERPPKQLQWITLPTITLDECEDLMFDSRRYKMWLYFVTLCVRSGPEFRGALLSDIGSPLVMDSTQKLIGILTVFYEYYWWIITGPVANAPSLFVNICKLRKWIDENTKL